MFKHRSLISIIAFMACITIFSFIMPMSDFVFASDYNLINSTLALIIIVFPAVEALVRYILTSKAYDPGKFFFAVNMNESYIRQGFYYAFLIIVILVVPFVRGSAFLNLAQVAMSAVLWLAVSAILLFITQKQTKVNFMNDAIIIKGIDLRLEFPMNDPIRTNSGIYSFKDFSGFYIEGSKLQLFLKDKQGHINATLPEDKVQHVIAFMLSKEIYRVQMHEIGEYKS